MSLPANDALSMATSPRRRPSTRSPSPYSVNISVSGVPGKGVHDITRQVIRRLSELQVHAEDGREGVIIIDGSEINEDGAEVAPMETNTISKVQRSGEQLVEIGEDKRLKEESSKIDWEIPRKILHSSIGFVTLYLYTSRGSPRLVIFVLWTALAVIIPADILRLNYPPFARVYEHFLGILMRESEKRSTNGVIWYILGVNFALTFYPLDVAVVAILILSWADTAASTIGRLFGSLTPRLPPRLPLLRLPLAPRKSIAGFIAASVTGACVAMCFWRWIAPCRPGEETWTFEGGAGGSEGWNGAGWFGLSVLGVVAGLVTGVAEALDLSLDDNLTLPIISGGCLFGFFKVLGWISSTLAS